MTTGTTEATEFRIVYLDIDQIIPDPENARLHPQRQIKHLRDSIREFNCPNPLLLDEQYRIIAGHGRHTASKAEGLTRLPCVILPNLTADQKKALALADNRIAELATWDEELLTKQLAELIQAEINIELTGFITAEVDLRFENSVSTVKGGAAADPDDLLPETDPDAAAVTCTGDVWALGDHLLLCADSLQEASFQRLLAGELAELVVCDSPYNVPIAGHVSGLGKVRHREFRMGSGELSKAEFTAFLATSMTLCAQFSIDGSIHYQFMDWRHMGEMLDAGGQSYSELKGLCVWKKSNAGMGSLYRSRHELVFVWKSGKAPHVNNIELGRHGRYRTNIWSYAGVNSFRKGRDEDIAAHPTVKPVGLIADAIRDCSKVGALVLDPFGGSGTTILAAERTKRRAAVIEIDPIYVDVAVRRWQDRTGKQALLKASGQTFEEVAKTRAAAQGNISGEVREND